MNAKHTHVASVLSTPPLQSDNSTACLACEWLMHEFNIDLAGMKWGQVDDYLKALCANVTVAKDKAVCNAVVLLYGEGLSTIILDVLLVVVYNASPIMNMLYYYSN